MPPDMFHVLYTGCERIAFIPGRRSEKPELLPILPVQMLIIYESLYFCKQR